MSLIAMYPKNIPLLLFPLLLAAITFQSPAETTSSNQLHAAGMGVERVARLFTPVYQQEAKKDDATAWVQVDLGADMKIDAVKLLPVIRWDKSMGFPARFKIAVSNDPELKTSTLVTDQSQAEYPDPTDAVVTFPASGVRGRYVRVTANQLRQKQLALTKLMVLSGGKDVAEGGHVSDSKTGDLGTGNPLTRPPRPQGENVVTDNPGNIIPPDHWKPVPYQAQAPLGGVEIGDGLFKKVMENNADYLLKAMTFNEITRHFLERAGKPTEPLAKNRNAGWFNDLPGSEAGHFLMGAGNSLRWIDNPALRKEMNQVVDVIAACREPDGFIMGYPREETFKGENGAYVRSWVTQGLLEAGYAGNPKAFPLLRDYYDWFNKSCYLPEILRRTGQGTQGLIPSTRMYFSPVGKPEDLTVVQRYLQENYWMDQLAKKEEKSVWRYPYDRPHCYLITALEPYLDLYRATGDKRYLDASLGGWELYHNHWQHVGGSIAICEGTDPYIYPPDSYYLTRGTGELCGNVFWIRLNQRFHLLNPAEEKYVSEIEKSIYNVGIANQIGSEGIRYFARLVDHKDPDRRPYFHCMNTCCEGQGTRLFGSLPEYLYSLSPDGIYVDLFAPSEIKFSVGEDPMRLKTTTKFPYEPQVRIEVKAEKPVQAKIRIRIPSWAASNMPVLVDGKEAAVGNPGSYLTLDRTWSGNEVISFILPMDFHITLYHGSEEGYKDGTHYSLEYGPFLMALKSIKDLKDLKVENKEKSDLVIHADPQQLTHLLEPISGKPLHFKIKGNQGLEYLPYWEVQDDSFTCFPSVIKKSEK